MSITFKLATVFAAGATSTVLLAIAHGYDWQRVFGRKLQPPWTYVAGLILLGLPFAGLMAAWRDWWALAGAVAVVIGGGLPVVFGYDIRGKVSKEKQDDQAQIIDVYRRRVTQLECELLALKGTRDGADPTV